MKKSEENGKITALYERLSHDDERAGESVSIENQKRILEDYARINGFTNIRHFTDDGVRGTTFKRPGLDLMLDEIRAGNVSTVIIKDQSRIGRDVVEVGLLKRTFDEYNVRFIAANDNLDTANGFDIMSIFRDVINEWYVADTSRKIKTVFKSRMEKGLRCSGSVAYGYLASKENKGDWIIDEEAAAVVRRIYQMTIAGETVTGICKTLRAEQIPIPSEHWKRIGEPVRSAKYTDPYAWSITTVNYILKRREYMGHKILGKTVCENYKTKSTRKTALEEQHVFEGAIPAIIDEETWNTVQRLQETKRRPQKHSNVTNHLTGILYCADCGSKLTHRHTLSQKKWIDDSFEEQRREQEEQAAREERSKELAQIRYEKRKQDKRDFTARKKAGLLTPEEQEAEDIRMAKCREAQKEWRAKRKAAEPPKPRKRSLTELAAAKREGLPLTPEEEERLAAYRQRKNEAVKRCRERKIAKEAAEKAEKGEKIA